MKSYLYIIALSILLIPFNSFSQCPENFHDFTAEDIHGNVIEMSSFAGKKLLVVNTASFCGYTYQYGQLQTLYDNYGGDNFEIIGFPANNFADQEPYDEDSIIQVCNSYNVTFTMMSKISVKGSDMHPIYEWLTQESHNCEQNATVNWNFQKFMINADGSWHGVASSSSNPGSSTIVNWITDPTDIESLVSNDSDGIKIVQAGDEIRLEMQTENKEQVSVVLYSTSGQKVEVLYNGYLSNEMEIPYSSDIRNGIYIVEIAGNGILIRKKLLIQ